MSTPKIRLLSPELQLIARTELFEDPNQIQEYLDILKQWLVKSVHIKARTDDQFLIAFLRGCKYSLERAKQKIDMFYTYRTHLTEIVGNRDPLDTKINEVIKNGVTLPLPITGSPGSPRLLFFRMNSYDPSRVRIEEIMKVFTMINDILLIEDDNSVVAGQICVCDVGNISMGHIIQMQPAFLKKAIMIWQESSPIRQKGVHYINAPKIFEKLFALVKSLLNEKMRNRIFMHPSLDSLYSMVPREMMPIEYGGTAGSLQSLTDEWEKKFLSHRDYFLTESSMYGVDEKKRIGAAKNPLLGIDGTFKQLQFD
ncbi:alpha-tocopherol transfer protein-like [Bradysia coprophila]|uniref:alpha-tocopherol transfer protein-like n=1 Tax=Bradysia coprophila TaxID=38358 RepID=UPI00187DB64D|nr:alpha-tocopherol transfer protein-like [Bradysia coprophila]